MSNLPMSNQNGNSPVLLNGRKPVAFDPIAELLIGNGSGPPELQPVNLGTLTPFQRALISIDGTVTKFIEAYMLEPVESVLLYQQTERLPVDNHWLALDARSEVVARQVLLRGRYSSTVYAYAVSLLVPTRLPAHLFADLAKEPAGLGRVLLNNQIENRRELLWYGREQITNLPQEIARFTNHDFISRAYRIIAGGQPLMLIHEKFSVEGCHANRRPA